MAGGHFATGTVVVVSTDGSARQVADGFAFPYGMAVTRDNSTLIVAESYAKKLTAFDILADGSLSNRRVGADPKNGGPGGDFLGAGNAVWFPDLPHKRWGAVRAGGEVAPKVR